MEENDTKEESENESAVVVEVSEPADEEKIEAEDSDVLELIRTRFEAKEFPAVQPQEVSAEELSSATAVGDMVRQHQHVRIQSYIDKKYAEYRELLPEDDVPETLIKARWARDTYYVHVKEILALMEKEDADFVPDVLPEDLDLARQAEAATTLRNLPEDRGPFYV